MGGTVGGNGGCVYPEVNNKGPGGGWEFIDTATVALGGMVQELYQVLHGDVGQDDIGGFGPGFIPFEVADGHAADLVVLAVDGFDAMAHL